MQRGENDRRGFLKRIGLALLGGSALPLMPRPARAGWSHRRGWYRGYGYGGYGFGGYRGFGFPGGYGFGGYRGFGFPGGYYGGYGGYGGGRPYFYNRGYYGAPFVQPYLNVNPYYYGRPGYYGGYGFYSVPLLKRDERKAIDALSLLEC